MPNAFKMMAASLGFLFVSTAVQAAPDEYELDETHTSIVFMADHIGYQNQMGMFLESEGSFTYDSEAGTVSDLRVVIQSDSIFSNHKKRDQHLKSPDFLNAREFPELVFEGTGAEKLTENTGRIMGNFTMLGQTRPMVLEVTKNKEGPYPWGDNYVIGLSATGSVKRSEFGMTYGVEDALVGDEITFFLEFEAIRQ